MRYLGQRDGYRCAPIVIINLLKWAGQRATEKDLDQLCEMMNCRVGYGTDDIDTNAMLKTLPEIKANKPRYIKSVIPIRRALKKRKAIIISHYSRDRNSGHIFLCVGIERGKFITVNNGYDIDKTVQKVPSSEMSRLLRRKGTKCWIIAKETHVHRRKKTHKTRRYK